MANGRLFKLRSPSGVLGIFHEHPSGPTSVTPGATTPKVPACARALSYTLGARVDREREVDGTRLRGGASRSDIVRGRGMKRAELHRRFANAFTTR